MYAIGFTPFLQKLSGVAVHPVYGGWFAIRGVIIFTNLELNEDDKGLIRPDSLNLISVRHGIKTNDFYGQTLTFVLGFIGGRSDCHPFKRICLQLGRRQMENSFQGEWTRIFPRFQRLFIRGAWRTLGVFESTWISTDFSVIT